MLPLRLAIQCRKLVGNCQSIDLSLARPPWGRGVSSVTLLRYFGWCSDSTHDGGHVSCEDREILARIAPKYPPEYLRTGRILGRCNEKMANVSTLMI